MKFIYTKNKDDVTEREVVVLSEPKSNYLTFDMTDSAEHINELQELMQELRDKENAVLDAFFERNGIEKKYRAFVPEKMQIIG